MVELTDIIQYNTLKVVTIKDKCLGILHYTFMLIIIAYVIIYKIIAQNGYVQYATPVGTARISLQGPTVDGCDPGYASPACAYNFTDVSDLPYCRQSGNTHYKGFKTLPCKDYDALRAVYPVTGGSPFYIATKILASNQTLVCAEPAPGRSCRMTYEFGCNHSFDYDPNCPADGAAQEEFYLANIEDFTLLIDHSVRSPTVQSLQADSVEMDGYLEGCNGAVIQPQQTSEKQDYFTIKQLLSVMQVVDGGTVTCGLELDDASTVDLSSHSVRSDGLIMIFIIDYENTKPWKGPSQTISYTYRVEFIKGTKSKITRELFARYPEARITEDRHGIKIVVLQTGQLGSFNITTLLLNLTTSLTLLAVATTGVDLLATRVLPNRATYYDIKYEEFAKNTDGELLNRRESVLNPVHDGGEIEEGLRNRGRKEDKK